MIKKNFKWFIKGTDNEVKLGDRVDIKSTITLSNSGGVLLSTEYEKKCVIDDAWLKDLEEDGLVCKKEHVPDYKDIIKAAAKKINHNGWSVIEGFNSIRQLNPMAGLSFVLKLISDELNKDLIFVPSKFWVFDTISRSPKLLDCNTDTTLSYIAWFQTKEDIDYAMKICKPLIDELYKS